MRSCVILTVPLLFVVTLTSLLLEDNDLLSTSLFHNLRLNGGTFDLGTTNLDGFTTTDQKNVVKGDSITTAPSSFSTRTG